MRLRPIDKITIRYWQSINPVQRIHHSRTFCNNPVPDYLGKNDRYVKLKNEFDQMVERLVYNGRVTVPHLIKGLRGAVECDDSHKFAKIFLPWWKQYEKCLPGEFPNQIALVLRLLGSINKNTKEEFRKSGTITRNHISIIEDSFIKGNFSQFYYKNFIPLYRGLYHLFNEDTDLSYGITYPKSELVDKTVNIINDIEKIRPDFALFEYSSLHLGLVYANILENLIFMKYKFDFNHQLHVTAFYSKQFNIWLEDWNFRFQLDFFHTIEMTGILARFFLYTDENPNKFVRGFLKLWFNVAQRLLSDYLTKKYERLPMKNINRSSVNVFDTDLALVVKHVPSTIMELCMYCVALAHKFDRFDLFVLFRPIWRDILISIIFDAAPNQVKQFYDVAVKAEEHFQRHLKDSVWYLLQPDVFDIILSKLSKYNFQWQDDCMTQRNIYSKNTGWLI